MSACRRQSPASGRVSRTTVLGGGDVCAWTCVNRTKQKRPHPLREDDETQSSVASSPPPPPGQKSSRSAGSPSTASPVLSRSIFASDAERGNKRKNTEREGREKGRKPPPHNGCVRRAHRHLPSTLHRVASSSTSARAVRVFFFPPLLAHVIPAALSSHLSCSPPLCPHR